MTIRTSPRLLVLACAFATAGSLVSGLSAAPPAFAGSNGSKSVSTPRPAPKPSSRGLSHGAVSATIQAIGNALSTVARK